MAQKNVPHKWQFKARFRRHAFGWKSQPAIKRIKEAVSEIKKIARKEHVESAEGAVVFLERLSAALERVDSSSGSIGNAVNKAIDELVPIIGRAPADATARNAWMERLFDAHAADEVPYIERLADHWGTLCASKEIASTWADRLVDVTRMALSPDPNLRGFFHGTSACLSALFFAERYGEIIELVKGKVIWDYKRWAVKALCEQGRADDAVRYAEACRSPWASDHDIDARCEEALLAGGRVDEAYRRYGLSANRRHTYTAWFRAIARKYPHRRPADILGDLAKQTPGDEGKWFAAAKDTGLFDEAIALATRSPCDPRTLARAARDYAERNPTFALESGVAALKWLVEGYGYEITSADVLLACTSTILAAENAGRGEETRERVRGFTRGESTSGKFIARIIEREIAR